MSTRTRRGIVAAICFVSALSPSFGSSIEGKIATAEALPPNYQLTTAVEPAASGSVTPTGGVFAAGATVTVTATPNAGWRFSHWAGDLPLGGWTRTMGGYEVRGQRVSVDGSGNVYVIGYFWGGDVDFDPTDGTDVHSPNGESDIFVTKLLSDGSYGWTRTMGGTGSDYGNDVCVDTSGNVYVTGRFSGDDVDLNPTAGVDLHSSNGSWDVFVTRLGSDGSYGWTRTIGDVSNEAANGVCVDGSGNVFVTGEFYSSSVDFNPTAGVDLHSPNGSGDLFVTKLGSDGSYGWTRTMGGASNECGYSVSVDGSGSVVATGYFIGANVDFDPTSGVDLHSSNGDEDAFVTKLGSDGSYRWTRTMGGTSHDFGESVSAHQLGSVYVTGYFEGSNVDLDPTSGVDLRSSNGAEDVFVTKLGSDGSYGWTAAIGGNSSDKGQSVRVDRSGKVVVVGSFQGSSVDFDPTAGVDLHSSNGGTDAFVTKLMADGSYGWTGTMGGTIGRGVSADGVGLDASGNVFVTGYFWGADVDFDPTGGVDPRSAIGVSDVFVTKLSPDGTYRRPAGEPTHSPLVLTMDSNKAVTATFRLVEYALTTDVAPPGSGRVGPVTATATYGTVLTVSATPNSGWAFDYWSGDVAHTPTAAATVTMDADKTVTAHFREVPLFVYQLTTSVEPADRGSVAPADGTFGVGTVVSLTATPNPGWIFSHWSGDLPAEGWTRTMGGYEVRGQRVSVDGSGNVYVIGYFWGGDVDFDPTDGTDVHSPNGESDIFVTKLLSDGSYGWTRTMGGTGSDYGNDVCVDTSGNVYVTGRFSGDDVDLNPTAGVDLHSSNGSWDVFVTRLGSDGSYGWTRTIGDVSNEAANGVCVDGSGNVFVTGEFYSSSVDFNPTAGVDLHSPNGSGDLFVTKLGSDGSYGWTRTMGGASNECGYSVSVDGSGSVVATGYFIGANVDFDPTSGVDLHSSNGDEDAFVTKLGSDGSYRWTRTMGGTSHDFGESVSAHQLGSVYVTGYFEGSNVDLDPTSGVDLRSSNGAEDVFVTKLGSDGSYGWTAAIGGNSSDKGQSVRVDRSGKVVVVGSFQGSSVDFDPTAGVDLHSSNGGTDAFVTKLMADGSYGWTGTMGGTIGRGVSADGVGLDASGNVFVTGYFWGADVDFDPTGGVDPRSAIGVSDVFVTKLRPDGSYGRPTDEPTLNPLVLLMDADRTVTAHFVRAPQTLMVTKSGAGKGSILLNGHARTLPYSGTILNSTVLTLTAVPSGGCAFVYWSDDLVGAANPITFTMDADKNVVVRFEPYVKTRFTTSPKAVPVYIDAVPHDTPYYPSFGAGTTHTVGVQSPVTMTGDIRLTFSHWAPEADQWHVLTWPSVGMKYTAYYQPQLKVTAEVSPPDSGAVTLTPQAAGGWYSPGSRIRFSASPAPGYEFWHWEFVGLGTTKNNPVVLDIGKSPVVAIAHMLAEGSGQARPKAVSPVGEMPLLPVTFVWEGVDGARCYDLWVASEGSDAPVLTLDGVAACKTEAVSGLPAGDYEWWVRAQSDEGTSGWSAPAHFSLRPEAVRQLPAPRPIAPLDVANAGEVTFTWTEAPGAASYDLWVGTAGGKEPVRRRAGLAGTACKLQLEPGAYRWAVRASAAGAASPWSPLVAATVK